MLHTLSGRKLMSKDHTIAQAIVRNFLGHSPGWYKLTIIVFLIVNPILFLASPTVAGWALIVEFIFTLAMALRCYPLQPGGLLAFEAIVIGMATPETVLEEATTNFEVILLLIFMVAGVFFLKNMLLFTFTKLLINVRSKLVLSLMFSLVAAVLSAFLDALTVTAVVIAVASGFYGVYHKVASGKHFHHSDHDQTQDTEVQELHREDLERFRAFLRSLVMHAAVGTALGGVTTLVGEPQNLLIANVAGWEFMEFFVRMAPVTMPVLVVGLATLIAVESAGMFGYGAKLPDPVRAVLVDFDKAETESLSSREKAMIVIQAIVAIFLVMGLAFHWAAVGLIGLSVIVLATAFCGVTEEHQLGHAFEEALPFTALLVVFFAIVGVIHEQHLFAPIISWVLTLPETTQPPVFFLANGLLSAISDNVFVATVYISEVDAALEAGTITRDHFDLLTVAINTGTNLPSVATPNGQAAFLFLLTSALAPVIRLSYVRMVVMALPYTITLTIGGLLSVLYLL
jgi:NhaB family Na+:H+ antiporter